MHNLTEQLRYTPVCNKTGYPSKKDALTKRNYILNNRKRNRPDKLRAYPCPDCGLWHLTKT